MSYNRLNFHKKILHFEFFDIMLKMAVDDLPFSYFRNFAYEDSREIWQIEWAQVLQQISKTKVKNKQFHERV